MARRNVANLVGVILIVASLAWILVLLRPDGHAGLKERLWSPIPTLTASR